MSLDKCNPVPLYQQIAIEMREEILANKYPDGYKLPNINELAAKYHVSSITLRKALNWLKDEGLVVCKQGKGTFIKSKKLQRDIGVASSFTRFCLTAGCTPSSEVIHKKWVYPDEQDMEFFKIDAGEKIVSIKRILYIDDLPVSIEANHFLQQYHYLLDEEFTNQSIMDILSKKYDKRFKDLKYLFELEYAKDKAAKYLNVEEGYPLLHLDIYANEFESGEAACRCDQLLIGDKFQFTI